MQFLFDDITLMPFRQSFQHFNYFQHPVRAETKTSYFKGTQRLLKRLLKGPADGHGFSNGLHLGPQR